MKKHYYKLHDLSWTGNKNLLYKSIKVQTFFSSGGLQKYFIINLDDREDREDGEKIDQNQVILQQLSDYQKVRKEIKDNIQVIEEAVKTNKTS
jgi:predicted AlkP superfamily phosphohydrolase/phosphomutase